MPIKRMLTELERNLLSEGARRVGVSEANVDAIIRSVASGADCGVTPELPGFAALPIPGRKQADLCFVLAYDPAVETSYSSGWSAREQKSAARLDGRDVARVHSRLWHDCAPYLWQLPTRLALNVLIADIAHTGGTGSFVRGLAEWGMFADQDSFELIGKRLSLAAKNREGWLHDPERYLEVNVLVGCRYPDRESATRVSDEIRASAPEEILPGKAAWKMYKKEAEQQRFKRSANVRTLREYIDSLEWKTDGSASMSGYSGLQFTASDASGVIRLTKALVPYVADFDELVSAVSNLAGCPSVLVKTVIKLGETSKDRVIYPYALAPTIAKAFLLSHIAGLGNYPLSDTFVTNRLWRTSLGESGWSEVFRHLRTLSLASPTAAAEALEKGVNVFAIAAKSYGMVPDVQTVLRSDNLVCLASDVKGFDKQVGITYSNEFWNAVRGVVPELSWFSVSGTTRGSPFTEFILPVDRELEYAAVHDRKELEKTADFNKLLELAAPWVVPNNAYLTSGTLETTKVGNRVSYVANRIAAKLIQKIHPGVVEMFDVRGDDQLATLRGVTSLHALAVAKLWWIATSAFFEYSPEKSRISTGHDRHTEFLRVDYSALGARGYLNRCLVWVTEARPLSSDTGYKFASKAVSGLQQVTTAIRRGASEALRNLMYYNALRALSSSQIPGAYLSAPASVGGAGVVPPTPQQFSSRTDGPVVTSAVSQWALSVNAKRYSAFTPTPIEIGELAASELAATISSSDAPEVRINTSYSAPVVKPLTLSKSVFVPSLDDLLPLNVLSSFGSMPGLESDVEKASAVARVRRVSMISLLPPTTASRLRDVEKRLKLPRRLAVEWLCGKISGFIGDCHPELMFVVNMFAARLLSQKRYRVWDARSSYYVISSYLHGVATAVQTAMRYLYMW